MADIQPVATGPRRGPRSTLGYRALAFGLPLVLGLALAFGVLVFRLGRESLPIGGWVALWLATTLVTYGFVGLFVRRFALTPLSAMLFGAGVFGVLALIGFLLAQVLAPVGEMVGTRIIPFLKPSDAVFYLFAVMTCAGAGGTAFSRNIIYSAWSLLFAFMGVAGLYIFLGADFPAVAQVLIYVGGILVLILFAIMLTKQIGEDPKLTNVHLALPVGAALGAAAVATLSYMAIMAPWRVEASPKVAPTSGPLGAAFLTDFLLPFEIASVVLLAALVGSVVIARKEIKETAASDLP